MPLPSMLPTVVLLPLIMAGAGSFLPRRGYHLCLFWMNVALVTLAARLFWVVRQTGAQTFNLAGLPDGIAIRLVADLYSAPLVLLTAVFFAGVFLFSTRAGYLDKTFLFLFTMLECGLLAIFVSGDLFNVYVLIELGMLIIAILIMYKKDVQSVYDAMLYLMMNFIAMAFMLLGIGYLYRLTGVLDMSAIAERLAQLEQPRAAIVPFALIMTAVSMKAALFPLFSWLPRAHGAPSAPPIVSAVLSGVQVKAGVYLLVRLGMVFEPVVDASAFFCWIGMATAIIGFGLAIAQKDIKLILAYHTVSQVGLIVMGLHLGTEAAFWGGMYHIINHALFKGLLFLTAGAIVEAYGTRAYSEIRGVLRRMPFIGIGTLAGVLGITGAPFFNGSISKYFIQEGLAGDWRGVALFVINLGTTLSFVKYAVILFGRPPERLETRPDGWMNLVSALFGAACLAGGIFGAQAVALLFGQTRSVAGAWALPKLLSFALTLAIALLAYRLVIRRIGATLDRVRTHKYNFNQVTVMLTLFFAALVLYLILG